MSLCENGFFPLAPNGANAINPCFLVICLLAVSSISILSGLISLVKLARVTHKPTLSSPLSTKHQKQLGVLFIAGALSMFYAFSLPKWGQIALGTQLFAYCVAVAVEYFTFYRSTYSRSSVLFFYLFEFSIFGWICCQRWFTDFVISDDGVYFDVSLAILPLIALIYDCQWFEPDPYLMDYYKEHDLYPHVNFFQNVTFTWMNPLIVQTYKEQTIKDPHNMSQPPADISVASSSAILEKHWATELWLERNSLVYAIGKGFGYTLGVAIAIESFNDGLTFVKPQLLKHFIEFFNPEKREDKPLIVAFFIALALLLVNVLETTLHNQFFILIFEVGMQIRGALMAMVYNKALKLSQDSRNEKSSGDIINLMSVDVVRIQMMAENMQDLIGAPIQVVVCLVSLYYLLGQATIAGIITMAIMIPINAYMSKKMRGFYKTQMAFKDERIKTVTELLTAIKSIKLYAWEKPMLEKLEKVRNDKELRNLQTKAILEALMSFSWSCVPFFVTMTTFAWFAFTSDTPLSPEIVFPSLTLFNALNDSIYTLPSAITAMVETSVAIGRLKSFLLAQELDKDFIQRLELEQGKPVVEIINSTFLWSSNKETEEPKYDEEAETGVKNKVALKDINFKAQAASLNCVVGRVGSGKSTFLQAILGQLPVIEGSKAAKPSLVVRGKTLAYCPQIPWIMNATVKENILFGHKFDQVYYEKTLKACQLLPDLEILADGDETLVGEKGISLSGGQKARLSLARAVYARADVYLLDDILSAVDAHVGRNIIAKVLSQDGLLKNKCVILATNNVSVLMYSSNISLLVGGSITETGSYSEIMERKDSPLKNLISEFGDAEAKEDSVSVLSAHDEDRVSLASFKTRPVVDYNKKTAQQAEKTEKGRVKASVYMAYAKACGIPGVCLFFILMIVAQIAQVGQNLWLKYWSEANETLGGNADVFKFVGVYGIIGLSSSLFKVVRTIVMLLYCSMRASRSLHNDMALAVTRAPMSFFETTPLGRIINRFSSDFSRIDDGLPWTFAFLFESLIRCITTIALIGYSMPAFLVVNAFLMVIYVYYQFYYIAISRELKRIISISFSPIMSLLGETLAGHTVINAYDHLSRFVFLNTESVQFNIDVTFTFRSINRWLSVRLQTMGAFITFSAGILAVRSLGGTNPVTAGMVGFLMSYAMQVSSSLMWLVRMSVHVESSVVCVERVEEYCKLTPEAPTITGLRPPENWPSRGAIEFRDYSTRYRANLDPVLNGISLNIQPQEKVGIVGRTGAGKSTLSLALFRLLEPTHGSIIIDGIDTNDIGLADLRSNLAIIPQDAQAFEGTVRSNLDPFGQYSDEKLWKVLELSHLKPHVMQMAATSGMDGLSCEVTENGGNLSVGQRQLLCLSRALLNDSKVLVLDEATAAVDVETDQVIQETIRTAFKDRTILTIAHRIDTVMESDKILVLDKGRVAEFDAPEKLLADKNSMFYKLCETGGYL